MTHDVHEDTCEQEPERHRGRLVAGGLSQTGRNEQDQ